MRPRRTLALLATASFAVVLLALTGAANSATNENPFCSKKPLCAFIGAQAESSRSPSLSPHYFSDSAEVYYDTSKGATSNMTNIKVVITWKDNAATETTSTYVATASDPRCVPDPNGAPRTLVCEAPKSLRAGDPKLEYRPLVFQTATEASGASGTTVTVTATGKEQITGKGGSPNEAVAVVDGTTSYEGEDDRDLSIAGDDLSVTLATKATGNVSQVSTLPVSANAERLVYEIVDENYTTNGGSATCPTGFKCFGQHVTVTAAGLSPVNLQITYVGKLPSGATEASIGLVHTLDSPDEDGLTTHLITAKCSGDFGTQPPDDEIYCRRVKITRLTGGDARVEIDAWDWGNGGWGGFG